MKTILMPFALSVCLLLVIIYLSAAAGSALFNLFAKPFDWVMDSSNRVIEKLESWGDGL